MQPFMCTFIKTFFTADTSYCCLPIMSCGGENERDLRAKQAFPPQCDFVTH